MEVARGKKANPFNLTVDQMLPSASMSIKSKLVQPVQRLPQLRLLAGELIKQCEKAVKRHVRIAAAGVLVSKKADAQVIGAVSKGVDAIGAAAALCNMAIKDRQSRERSAVLHSAVFSSGGATLAAPETTSRRLVLECGALMLYVDPSAPAAPKPKAGLFKGGLFAKKSTAPKRQQLVVFSDALVVASVDEASGDGGQLGDIYQVERSTITHVFALDALLPAKVRSYSCFVLLLLLIDSFVCSLALLPTTGALLGRDVVHGERPRRERDAHRGGRGRRARRGVRCARPRRDQQSVDGGAPRGDARPRLDADGAALERLKRGGAEGDEGGDAALPGGDVWRRRSECLARAALRRPQSAVGRRGEGRESRRRADSASSEPRRGDGDARESGRIDACCLRERNEANDV
jgi:hypothetical protein